MKDINAEIWDVETNIRNGKRNNLTFEEVGRLAVQLRDLNDIRGKKKTGIMEEISIDFFEIPPKQALDTDTSLKLPLHETVDRVTITELYLERLPEHPNRRGIERELAFYLRVLDAYRAHDGVEISEKWLRGMKDINGRVWDREAAIRQGREKEFGLEEMGRRTLELRDLSKERVAWKNMIAQAVGLDFYEVKTETT